jgi:oligo-1,6-glucosidase
MKREVLSKYDIITVGETAMVTTQNGLELTNEATGPLNMLFHFEHMEIDRERDIATSRRPKKAWRLTVLKQIMTRWQKDLEGKGWNSIYLDNHDQPRLVSRFGDDGRYRVESAKMLATFIHMQQGTPYIYQGEEIGMTNVAFDSIEQYRDIAALNMYRELVQNQGVEPQAVLEMLHATSRDNARTPMQWDDSEQAGFTSGTPWIEVNPNYTEINVEQALADPNSIFYYYQKLLQLRKEHPIIVYGAYDLILDDHEEIYAFTRTGEDGRLLVILNFSKNTPVFTLPAHLSFSNKELLISNYEVNAAEGIQELRLRPFEARAYFLTTKT